MKQTQNQTQIEKIIARRRSTDPHCWTCKTYPNCDLCHRRTSLRHQPKRTLTPEQKKACKKIIQNTSLYNLTITPKQCRIKAKAAEELQNLGILTLIKKAEYSCNYQYQLNTTNPQIEKAWIKHTRHQARKLNKELRKKP